MLSFFLFILGCVYCLSFFLFFIKKENKQTNKQKKYDCRQNKNIERHTHSLLIIILLTTRCFIIAYLFQCLCTCFECCLVCHLLSVVEYHRLLDCPNRRQNEETYYLSNEHSCLYRVFY